MAIVQVHMSSRGTYRRQAPEFKIQLCQDIRSDAQQLVYLDLESNSTQTFVFAGRMMSSGEIGHLTARVTSGRCAHRAYGRCCPHGLHRADDCIH